MTYINRIKVSCYICMGGPGNKCTTVHLIRPFICRQASVFLNVTNVNDRIANGELEVLAEVRIAANNIAIFYRLIFAYLIMETHGFSSTPIQSISSFQGTVPDDWMSQEFGFLFNNLCLVRYISTGS